MEDNGVKTHAVEEAKTESKLLEIIEDRTTNFDDSKFGRLGRVRGRRKDAKVTLHFTFRTERIEEAGDRILHICQHVCDCLVEGERTLSVWATDWMDLTESLLRTVVSAAWRRPATTAAFVATVNREGSNAVRVDSIFGQCAGGGTSWKREPKILK